MEFSPLVRIAIYYIFEHTSCSMLERKQRKTTTKKKHTHNCV